MSSKSVLLAIAPLIILGGVVYYLLGPGTSFLYTTEPLPEVTIENAEFKKGTIIAYVRNTGQDTVTIAQGDVNDIPWEATIEPSAVLPRMSSAKVEMKFPWIETVPYEIGITTSDGTRFAYEVEAAATTPDADSEQLAYFAILGSYVGIVPVMIGLLWYPFMSRIGKHWYSFFLSLTAGLLVFLAVDALTESFEFTHNIASAFRGEVLIAASVIGTFLALMFFSERMRAKTETTVSTGVTTKQFYGLSLSYMVAIGIGLHNLGEGLAIGAAVALGSIALSKFLITGFAIHNTTEGLAIVAPIAKHKTRIMHLLALGLIAGAPTIAGTWIGGFTYMPLASIVFLSIGAGAIFQVVYSIFSWMNREENLKITSSYSIAGFILGLAIMYFTGLLV